MDKKINHLAIIPDGNRRWAQLKKLPSLEGHRRGFDTALKLSRYIRKIGIHTFTLWAFSTENWRRTTEEVGYLMRLYADIIDKFLKEAAEDNVRVIHLGRKDRIPDFLKKKIDNIEKTTINNTTNVLNIALDYGGHDDIVRAVKKMKEQNFDIDKLDETNFYDFLDTTGQPHPTPDLVIRTSGEIRTSGFMTWQAAYSELLFVEKHFPDMNEQDIDEAVAEFARRGRRFGK